MERKFRRRLKEPVDVFTFALTRSVFTFALTRKECFHFRVNLERVYINLKPSIASVLRQAPSTQRVKANAFFNRTKQNLPYHPCPGLFPGETFQGTDPWPLVTDGCTDVLKTSICWTSHSRASSFTAPPGTPAP